MRTNPHKTVIIIAAVITVSLIYFFAGNPAFYEKYLGTLTERAEYGFLAPALYHFAVTLLLFFFLPLLIIKWGFREEPASYGWQVGDRKAGWAWLAVGLPLVLLLAWLSSGRKEFTSQYPLFLSRISDFHLGGKNLVVFILYELAYVFFYLGWEFFFRGFALFGLKDDLGAGVALLFQAVISTGLHLSRPRPEMIAAFPGGIVFGLAALNCRSLRTVILVHWLLGFFLDLFILLR